MNVSSSKHAVHARRHRKVSVSDRQLARMAIILVFIFLSTLISLWLPVYMAHLPLIGS